MVEQGERLGDLLPRAHGGRVTADEVVREQGEGQAGGADGPEGGDHRGPHLS